jgi:hypothetical protein
MLGGFGKKRGWGRENDAGHEESSLAAYQRPADRTIEHDSPAAAAFLSVAAAAAARPGRRPGPMNSRDDRREELDQLPMIVVVVAWCHKFSDG